MRVQFDIEKSQFLAEIEAERSHHQRILKDYNRLQQRFENLQDEVEILQSPTVSPNKDQIIGELMKLVQQVSVMSQPYDIIRYVGHVKI
jgi:predicted nuclease with TOPRIM domain